MTILQDIADAVLPIIASYPELSAGVIALVGSWLLYGVLGKKMLGADDDFWERIRTMALPLLDQAAVNFPGFYGEGSNSQGELAAIVDADVETVELVLEQSGYQRNPMASLKTNPKGWTEAGSWATRYGVPVRGLGDRLREKAREMGIPGPKIIADVTGRFLQAVGDILATKQTHVTLYEDPGKGAVTWVYAHEEPNVLNPVTAWVHYSGRDKNPERGVKRIRSTLSSSRLDFSMPPRESDTVSG